MLFIYIPSIYWKKGPHCRHPNVGGPYLAFKLVSSRNFRCAFGRFPERTMKHCFLVGVNDSLFSTTIWQTAARNDLCCQNKAENNRHKGTKRRQTHTHKHISYIYTYMVTTFTYVEGGPDREAPEVVYEIPVRIFKCSYLVTVCINEWDSVCLNGRAGQGKPSGGSLKYLFVYLKVRIFKCSYRIYRYISIYIYKITMIEVHRSAWSAGFLPFWISRMDGVHPI